MGDYLEQETVINKAWINSKDIRVILPIKKKPADDIVTEILNEMKSNKEKYFNTRPRLIPTRKIVEKYNIDVNLIRREARRMKG